MTSHQKRLPYRARRLLALMKGKELIDEFPDEEPITLYYVSRDVIIHCTKNNISDYLETFE